MCVRCLVAVIDASFVLDKGIVVGGLVIVSYIYIYI